MWRLLFLLVLLVPTLSFAQDSALAPLAPQEGPEETSSSEATPEASAEAVEHAKKKDKKKGLNQLQPHPWDSLPEEISEQ